MVILLLLPLLIIIIIIIIIIHKSHQFYTKYHSFPTDAFRSTPVCVAMPDSDQNKLFESGESVKSRQAVVV